jgi:hypothetical protein
LNTINISASTRIMAPASRVYGIIADYREGHPHIVPPRYFRNLVVEEGGIGEGTKIRFEMVLFGKVQQTGSVVTEPEPGRVLMESTVDGLAVTRFIVDPLEDGKTCRVTIDTDLKSMGFIGNALIRLLFRRIYREELALLAAQALRGSGRG